MNISEYFGTIQGEGKYTGTPSLFLRTLGCNLRCAWKNNDGTITKCDTPYTSWNPEKGKNLSIDDILNIADENKLEHIVITGGEPTLQQDIEDVNKLLSWHNYKVTVETNGTIYKNLPRAFMSISPKLSNSNALENKLHEKNNNYMSVIEKYITTNDYQLKFVVNNQEDINEILKMKNELKVPSDKIYLMPQGISNKQFDEKNDWIIEQCKKYNFKFSPRLHIMLWGNIRGV